MTSIYGSKKENRCTFVLQSSPSNMSSHNALISMSRRHRLPFCPDPSQQPSILITHSYRKLFAAICTLSASHVTILVALGGGGEMGENLQLLLLLAWKEWWRFVKRASRTLQLACCVFIRSAVDFIAAVMLATVVIAVGWGFLSTLELKSRATRTWTWHVPRWHQNVWWGWLQWQPFPSVNIDGEVRSHLRRHWRLRRSRRTSRTSMMILMVGGLFVSYRVCVFLSR